MQFTKPTHKSDLEKVFLDAIEKDTPPSIKESPLIDLNNKDAFDFSLTHDQLKSLGIESWFENYQKEAKASTAGIRGLQNPLYPWDTRYPLNLIGVMLATMGKILVAQDQGKDQVKIAAGEVRYNTPQYIELIARLQAGNGVKTIVTQNYSPVPIFITSFLVFMNDLYGGEYVTSSHAISKKIATKDLNTQGSQYIPSESALFVDKVAQILNIIRVRGFYTFHFSADSDPLVDRHFLNGINNGVNLYLEYLKQGIATPINLSYIQNIQKPILVECMGGSISSILTPIINELKLHKSFVLIHPEEDPFYHQIGKTLDSNQKCIDLGCDTTIMKTDQVTQQITTPVIDTIGYSELLRDYPVGTTLLMTDPDADRLVTSYIDTVKNIHKLKTMGLVYTPLDNDRILVVFTPNQSFLLTIDFQYQALVKAGLWDKYNWFLMKTTASQRSWDEWAMAHNIPIINTPVGFKELADPMQQIEKKILANPGQDIYIKDVYGQNINLGKAPRLLFAGEESGGEIFGPSELITSLGGRQAISMREKSAGEAILITSALAAYLESESLSLADYLQNIYQDNNIKSRFEIRIDQRYYNENEPDINTLLKAKAEGMKTKTANNSYFLSLALGYRDNLINLNQVKTILSESFPQLNFSDLTDVKFVGDGTYFLFEDRCVEVRPSGTDAINKGYSYGQDQWECIKYASTFSAYDGTRGSLHQQLIPQDFYNNIENYAFEIYSDYKQNQ